MLVMISTGLGGLGLFLLGMWLMSEGLKSAAGGALNQFLQHWTDTRLRGLGVGFLLTALIQSSSAVTVATLGFTNAGLLTLERAVWIIFGSNIGTTVTGWLVALIGFNINISAFALPLIGIGMLLKLTRHDTRIGHIGQALVGFGILFLGIDVLKQAFSSLGGQINLTPGDHQGIVEVLMYSGFGFIITVLMQSSSVTLAITLTALSGGVITLIPAAAIVIGSNLGTTTTAILAAFGTNPAAKRVVASHVLFNLITAIVSLVLLSPLLVFIQFFQGLFVQQPLATTTLALFHTLFNLLGVAIMWPLATIMIRWLSKRFRTEHEDDSEPRYLDKNALALPSLALHGLTLETERVSHYVVTLAKDSINNDWPSSQLINRQQVVQKLALAIDDYTSEIYRQNLTETMVEQLPVFLRIMQYYDTMAELAVTLNNNRKVISSELEAELQQTVNDYQQHSTELILCTDFSLIPISSLAKVKQDLDNLESRYQSLKSLLLRRGAEGRVAIARMERTLTTISLIRRINQQAVKAFNHYCDNGINSHNQPANSPQA